MDKQQLAALQAKAAALVAQQQTIVVQADGQPSNVVPIRPEPEHIVISVAKKYDGVANWFSAIPYAWKVGRSM